MWKKPNCVLWRDRFFVYIKIDDIYKYIAEDVETSINTANYELDTALPKVKNKSIWIKEKWIR